MREKRERAGEVQSRDDDALSSPSQQGNACMHSVATGKRYLSSMRYCCWYWTPGAGGRVR